jgi:hypothetical protein
VTLSLCSMTGSDEPRRLAAILDLFRPVVDEIVVAVDDRHPETAAVLTAHADRLVLFSHLEPCDRPIPWLFDLCNGRWILNVDDDEVPSQRLLDELPRLVARDDVTHYWIARRWLFPDARTYLDEPPWSTEYQLRLVLADPRFLQFSDEFHRPVVCHGPMRFLQAPLWHLDTVINSVERRHEKALRYERERRGMRIAGFSHNSGLYLPELREGMRLASVPRDDARLVERVLAGAATEGRPPCKLERATRGQVDQPWPGGPFDETLYRARLTVHAAELRMIAGVQQTVDVVVTNASPTTWPWSAEGQPAIRLGYRWQKGPDRTLRTTLPCDLVPGESAVVPLHVVPPVEVGEHVLTVDLVHEFVRWFGLNVRVPVVVRPRRRVAVAGEPSEIEAILDVLVDLPEVEPVLVGADDLLPDERFGHARIPGLRSFLFPSSGRPSPRLFERTARLLMPGAFRQRGIAGAFLQGIAGCDAFVIAGADWDEQAPPTRERWRLATTVAAARSVGVPVLRVGSIPDGRGLADSALESVVARLARPVRRDAIAESLAELGSRRP